MGPGAGWGTNKWGGNYVTLRPFMSGHTAALVLTQLWAGLRTHQYYSQNIQVLNFLPFHVSRRGSALALAHQYLRVSG